MTYPMVRWQIEVMTQAGHSAKGAMEAVAAARQAAKEGSSHKQWPLTVFHANEIAYRYDMRLFLPGNPESYPSLLGQDTFNPATHETLGLWQPTPNVPNQWRVTWLAAGPSMKHMLSRDVARNMWEILVADPMQPGNNQFVVEFHQPWERAGWEPVTVQWVVEVNLDGTMTPTPYGVSADTRWFALSTWPEEA